MTQFTRFVRAVEQRATTLAGLRISAATLLLASIPALAAALVFYAVPNASLPLIWQICVLAVPLLTALLGNLLGRMAKHDAAHLLLQVDVRLGLGERLSSLYEVRVRGGRSVFRTHLEASVAELRLDTKRGLPVPRRVRWALNLGAAFLVGAAVFVALPPRAPAVASPVDAAPLSASQSLDTIGDAPFTAPDLDITPPATLDTGEAATVVRESPSEQFRLEDVFSELRGTEGTSQSIVGDATPDELSRLIDEQRETAEMIREFLESILERVRKEGGGLTDDEREQIRDQAGQAGDPQLVESLMDLLDESEDGEGIAETLESLLSTFDLENQAPDANESEGQSQAIPLRQSDPDWSPEMPTMEGSRPEDESSATQEQAEEADPENDEEADPLAREGLSPGHEEDPDMEGGDDAQDAESRGLDAESPEFSREDAPSAFGESGDFSSFITEGVPVELPTWDDPDRDALIVDFDRIQSILQTRGVSEDVIDAVRRYFELITEGGS